MLVSILVSMLVSILVFDIFLAQNRLLYYNKLEKYKYDKGGSL